MGGNENENNSTFHQPSCLLEKHIARPNRVQKLIAVGEWNGSNLRGHLGRAGKGAQI